MASTNMNVTISIDPESLAKLRNLEDRLNAIGNFEILETEELTFSWPYWMLFLASVGGGLTVLLAFFLIGSVFA